MKTRRLYVCTLFKLFAVALLSLTLVGSAASQSDKSAPQPDPVSIPCPTCRFNFGMFGFIRTQTARLNIVDAGDVQPGPCRRAELEFLDSQSNILARSVECLMPGHAVSLALNGNSLESSTNRAEIRATVRLEPPGDPDRRTSSLVATVEVFDNATGRTAFLVPLPPLCPGSAIASNFSISVSPSSGSVTAGNFATATVSTAVLSGSAQTVSFSVSGLPAGAAVAFSPASVTAGDSSTMTVSTVPGTPAGTYQLVITGTGSSASHATAYTLTLIAG